MKSRNLKKKTEKHDFENLLESLKIENEYHWRKKYSSLKKEGKITYHWGFVKIRISKN